MKTQRDDLKAEIKDLEKGLKFATINSDTFTQMALYKRLVDVKSLLINIRIMITNFSDQTTNELLTQYEFRVEALQNKIEELKALLEINNLI